MGGIQKGVRNMLNIAVCEDFLQKNPVSSANPQRLAEDTGFLCHWDLRFCFHPPFQKRMDLLRRRHDRSDRGIMIQGINDDGKVLA